MGDPVEEGKVARKQDATLGRGAKAAIWTALIAAAGTFLASGVPEIIRLFSSRPPLEAVQDMIADQTDKLTAATNRNVEMLKKQQEALQTLDALLGMHREELARVTGCVETVRDVVRDCCTKHARDLEHRVVVHESKAPDAVLPAEKAVESLKKVPPMERPWQMQQQAQVPE